MPVSLSEALKKSTYNLGTNFEKLGKNEGVFAGRNFLDYNKQEGWKVRRLNCILILVRWVFGAIGNTHLRHIAYQLRRENAEIAERQLTERIWGLWNKAHPEDKVKPRLPRDPQLQKKQKEAALLDLENLKARVDSPHFKAKIEHLCKVLIELEPAKIPYIQVQEIEPSVKDLIHVVRTKRQKLDDVGKKLGLDFAKLTQLEEEREEKMILSKMQEVILQLTTLQEAVKGDTGYEKRLTKIIEKLKTPVGYDAYCTSADLSARLKALTAQNLESLDSIEALLKKLDADFAEIDREVRARDNNKRVDKLSKFHSELPSLINLDEKKQQSCVKAARQALLAALDALGGKKIRNHVFFGRGADYWTLNFGGKKDEELIQVAAAELSVGEIRAMQESAKVRYLCEDGLDKDTLKQMLKEGAGVAQRKSAALWCCVSSDVYITHDINGTPLQEMAKVGMYHMSPQNKETGDYFDDECHFKSDAYRQILKKQLGLFLLSAQVDGRQMPILSGFGQFESLKSLTPKGKAQAHAQIARALVELVTENNYPFVEIVFAEGNLAIRTAIENAKKDKFAELEKKGCKIAVTDKPSLEVARSASLHGFEAAFLKEASPSCYPEQSWEWGQATREEAHALFTTLLMAQYLPANEFFQKEWDKRCIKVNSPSP